MTQLLDDVRSALSPGNALDFRLPPGLEAGEPPELRGLARDDVRLMVSHRQDNRVIHTHFRDFPRFLRPGDVLVINTSGTMPAALPARRNDGAQLALHLSTRLPADLWTVELRLLEKSKSKPFFQASAGETLSLPGGGSVTLLAPYSGHQPQASDRTRLWVATLTLPTSLDDYLSQYGSPIRYDYVDQAWPIEYYQTVYATEMGSAEMPSAGRAFTPELITRLIASGVQVVPLLLHTGVASLEAHEPPYEEFFRVPEATATTVNAARAAGKQVIAIGTTVVRALESAAGEDGTVHPTEGWTGLVITPCRHLRAVTGMLTGFHEPAASHLSMLDALAGKAHLALAYEEALRNRYLWHEFGDLHLIVP